MRTEVGSFEFLDLLVSRPTDRFDNLKRQEAWGKEVSLKEFESFFDEVGRLVKADTFKERIFYGGFSDEARPEVHSCLSPPCSEGCTNAQGWKYLFGLWNENWTREKCEYVSQKKQEHYEALRSQWETITADQVTSPNLARSTYKNTNLGKEICQVERQEVQNRQGRSKDRSTGALLSARARGATDGPQTDSLLVRDVQFRSGLLSRDV